MFGVLNFFEGQKAPGTGITLKGHQEVRIPTQVLQLILALSYPFQYICNMAGRSFIIMFSAGLFFATMDCKANNLSQSCPVVFSFSEKADAIDNFWSWFRQNEKNLRQFESDPQKFLSGLTNEINKIQKGLIIELEPPQKGIINMTISANGDKDLFPAVQAIVAKAPKITGWNIIAFRQRVPIEDVKKMRIKAAGQELNPSQMKFYPLIEGKKLDIIVYVAGITEENFDKIAYGGLLLLDHLLGEYDCVTKVRSYDFHEMPVRPEELQRLLPLPELVPYLDRFYAAKK